MKKIITLNEEFNRMKSLFNDSRVHGNLNESILLTEQGIGKKLMKALSSVAVVLKGFDPKLLYTECCGFNPILLRRRT